MQDASHTAKRSEEKHHHIHVLFLSRENDPRAQLASGLLNHLGKGRFVASCMPVELATMDAKVISVLKEINIEPTISAACLESSSYDYIINICDRSSASCSGAESGCPNIPDSKISGCWGYSNPMSADNEDSIFNLMRSVRDEIANRICIWMPAAVHAKKESHRMELHQQP